MGSFFDIIGCCCFTGPDCPPGPCADSSEFIRIACGRERQWWPTLDIEGTAGTAWIAQTSLLAGTPATVFGSGEPMITDAKLAMVLTTPARMASPMNGNTNFANLYQWRGHRKRIEINADVHEFDGTVGMGVAATPTFRDRSPWGPHYPVNFRDGTAVVPYGSYPQAGFTKALALATLYTEWRLTVTQTALPGAGGNVGAYVDAQLTRGRKVQHIGATVTTNSSHELVSYTETPGASATWSHYVEGMSQAARFNVGSEWFNEGFSLEMAGNFGAGDLCLGASLTATLAAYGGTGYPDGEIPLGEPPSIPPSGSGSATTAYAPPDGAGGISVSEYGARNCPCAIRITGSIWVTVRTDTDALISPNSPPWLYPRVYDEGAGEWTEASGAVPVAFKSASVELRAVRNAPPGCGPPPASWSAANAFPPYTGTTPGTVTIGGVAHVPTTLLVERWGPRLYRLFMQIDGVESNDGEGGNTTTGTQEVELFYTVGGDCPTGVAAVEQFAQAHEFKVASFGAEPTYEPVNPAVTSPFTNNSLSIILDFDEPGDPACGCDEASEDSMLASSALVQSVLDEATA